MSKINVTNKTFPNIAVIAFLFDKLLHRDEVSVGNELFEKFVDQLKQKGFLPLIRDYYLKMDPQDRLKYKLIKDAFEGVTTSNNVINIVPEKFEKKPGPEKKGFIKKIIQKIVSDKELEKDEFDYLIEKWLEKIDEFERKVEEQRNG